MHIGGSYAGAIKTNLENAAKVEKAAKENGIPVEFVDHE
jgi:hypothetical protein